MKRLICFVIVTAALVCGSLIFSPHASAITYGFIDSTNTFANTGAFLVKDSSTGQVFPICSGTMITSNVFLTASHCTAYFTQELAPQGYVAYVSLDGSIPFGNATSNNTKLLAVANVVTNPNYNQSQSDSGDIAVLILAKSVRVTPATLPSCGLLDQLVAQNGLKTATFTNVGYGLQNRVVGGGGVPFYQDLNPVPRMFSFSSFNSLNGGYLRLSQNPSTGNGGTCFGDSGGPNFMMLDGRQLIVSITITGDSVCRSTNVDYRLDIASVQAFFASVNAAFGTSIPVSC